VVLEPVCAETLDGEREGAPHEDSQRKDHQHGGETRVDADLERSREDEDEDREQSSDAHGQGCRDAPLEAGEQRGQDTADATAEEK